MASPSFIVGDAGGSSTQWRMVDGDDMVPYETIGFNAYTHSMDDFKASIFQTFGKKITTGTLTYLYAAGVDTEEQRSEIGHSLQTVFGENLSIENDLVGVARALCDKDFGNVCILGTGSNAGIYDGKRVNKVSTSLGYVLGDEGSGAYLGKNLMKGVFRNQFSKKIVDAFQDKFHLTSHQVIQQIYHQPKPNHFLASFTPFIYDHRMDPKVYRMIYSAFENFFMAFFGENIKSDFPFYFSGSIAWIFSDILRMIGNEKGVIIKNIVQSPISELALYHKKHG